MTEKKASAQPRTGLLMEISLLAGLYLVVAIVVLLGACLFLPVALALRGHVTGLVLFTTEFIAVGSVPGIMIIYYCIFALQSSDDEPNAAELPPGDVPRLREMVAEVAAAVGTRPPATLRVSAQANATVFEKTRLLGFASGRRSLTIGMPLLIGLTTAELRAVIAHELGHYARGHTRLGAQVYRGSVGLRNACQSLVAARETSSHRPVVRVMWRARSLYVYVAYGIFLPYSAFYDRVSFAARRRHELQADACAAENFGTDVTASALRSAHALPEAWSRFRTAFLEPMRRAGYVPDEPFRAFEAMLADPDYRDVLAELRMSPPERPVSRLDSHPTLAQRLAALPDGTAGPGRSAGPSVSAAADLLTDDEWQVMSRRLRRTMFGLGVGRGGVPDQELTWREWVSTAARLRAVGPAAELIRVTSRQSGVVTVTLDTVLDLLAAGRSQDLACALTREEEGSSDTALAVLAGTLCALTGHYLAEAGRAKWAVCWTGPSRLIAADIAAEELAELVAAAVYQPAVEVARLRLHLASLGIDPAARTPVTSVLQASDGSGGEQRGTGRDVWIRSDADLVSAERQRTIRVMNIAVGIVTGIVALFGTHAWTAAHSPPSFTPVSNPVAIEGTKPPFPYPLATPRLTFSPIYLPITIKVPPSALVTSVIVQPGDSLSALACRYNTTVKALQTLNHLGQSTVIYAGQRLSVPFTFAITGAC
jgi:Zn-dependent protease with chaperone function